MKYTKSAKTEVNLEFPGLGFGEFSQLFPDPHITMYADDISIPSC